MGKAVNGKRRTTLARSHHKTTNANDFTNTEKLLIARPFSQRFATVVRRWIRHIRHLLVRGAYFEDKNAREKRELVRVQHPRHCLAN